MLKQATLAAAAAVLMIGSTSMALASKDDSGDYKGGALFGPEPGQVFSYPGASYGYYPPGPYGYYPRGAYAFVPRGGSPANPPGLKAEFPTAPWEEY